MRRAQSVRTYPRTSLNLATPATDLSDLSTLRETDEPASVEDTLRRQLLEKDRENDKVRLSLPPLYSLTHHPLTRMPAPIHHPLPPNPTRLQTPPRNDPIPRKRIQEP